MKNFVLCLFILVHAALFGQDTFSIVAVDTATGEVGSAGASCINGAIIISDLHPGVGAIHTQSYWNTNNQQYASSLMVAGFTPQQIIDSLAANDAQNDNTIRQYGVVDWNNGNPRTAAFTGSNCLDDKFHKTGFNYAIQGNILIDSSVIDSIESGFLNATGPLADRLMAALQGANFAGADSRCLNDGTSSKSAFVRVARPSDGGCYYVDLNVNSTPIGSEPIDSLQRLYDDLKNCTGFEAEINVNVDTTDIKWLNGRANFYNSGTPSSCYYWDMGDGTIIDNSVPGVNGQSFQHNYQTTGTFNIIMVSQNMNCIDTAYASIVVVNDIFNPTAAVQNPISEKDVKIYPNPANEVVNIELDPLIEVEKIEIQTIDGRLVKSYNIFDKQTQFQWNTNYRTGMFIIRVYGKGNVYSKKIEVYHE